MIEYFAVAVNRLESFMIEPISKLNPDLVQIPLHIKQPSLELIEAVNDTDTDIIGKWVTPKNYKSFDRAFFERLVDKYDMINIWDFGGEPETRPEQNGCRWFGTDDEFVECCKVFVDVVKSKNPKAIVGSGGFLTATLNGYFGNEDRSEFFEKVMDKGLGDIVDYISVNAYIYGYGGTKNVIAGIGRTKEILARYNCDKPIVVAETGVPCGGDPHFLHIIQSEERHANSIIESHILFHSLGVKWIVWFQLCDEAWGLIHQTKDGLKVRKGAQTYKYMIKTLKGAKYTKRYKAFPSRSIEEKWLSDKVEWHVFDKGDDTEIHVIWITGGQEVKCKVPIPLKIYNREGTRGIEPNVREEITLRDPVYIWAEKGKLNNETFMVC
jgi:hypothetical protein